MQEIRFHGRGGQGTVVADLRSRGEKIGLLKIKMFRPFPTTHLRRQLGSAGKVAVIDRNFSFGASGIFAQEIRAALCSHALHPAVFGYVAGLGGRDITPDTLKDIYAQTKHSSAPSTESIWIGLNHEVVASWPNEMISPRI